jgi:hypothetical protein
MDIRKCCRDGGYDYIQYIVLKINKKREEERIGGEEEGKRGGVFCYNKDGSKKLNACCS